MSLWTLVLVLNLLAHPTTADKHQRVRKVRKFLNPRGFLTNRFQVTRECTQLNSCRDKNLVRVPTVRKEGKRKFFKLNGNGFRWHHPSFQGLESIQWK